LLNVKHDLVGRKVLVTAGPTVEPIDAVRFISNPSSGKTGFAIAEAALDRGAEVVLVTGPVSLGDVPSAQMVRVTTAVEMYDAVDNAFDDADIAVFTAAVSDYRPANPADRKLKKGADDDALRSIDLVENPDILASMGARKKQGQVVVGFAAETNDVESNARKKLASKHADMIDGNDVSGDLGFGTDENAVLLVTTDGAEKISQKSKLEIANDILDKALELL